MMSKTQEKDLLHRKMRVALASSDNPLLEAALEEVSFVCDSCGQGMFKNNDTGEFFCPVCD